RARLRDVFGEPGADPVEFDQLAHGLFYCPATGLARTPRPSISTSIRSPGLRKTGGLRANPTPAGVPVEIMSPGSSVMKRETNSIRRGMSKISCEVLESCIVWPLRRSLIERSPGLGTSSAVTT